MPKIFFKFRAMYYCFFVPKYCLDSLILTLLRLWYITLHAKQCKSSHLCNYKNETNLSIEIL